MIIKLIEYVPALFTVSHHCTRSTIPLQLGAVNSELVSGLEPRYVRVTHFSYMDDYD